MDGVVTRLRALDRGNPDQQPRVPRLGRAAQGADHRSGGYRALDDVQYSQLRELRARGLPHERGVRGDGDQLPRRRDRGEQRRRAPARRRGRIGVRRRARDRRHDRAARRRPRGARGGGRGDRAGAADRPVRLPPDPRREWHRAAHHQYRGRVRAPLPAPVRLRGRRAGNDCGWVGPARERPGGRRDVPGDGPRRQPHRRRGGTHARRPPVAPADEAWEGDARDVRQRGPRADHRDPDRAGHPHDVDRRRRAHRRRGVHVHPLEGDARVQRRLAAAAARVRRGHPRRHRVDLRRDRRRDHHRADRLCLRDLDPLGVRPRGRVPGDDRDPTVQA